MNIFSYNNKAAVDYARQWAFLRNPIFYNFDNLGGDCTNFVSQCLYAGCRVMNYTNTFGWYYNSINDRAPAWTGVDEFFNFLTQNKAEGPFAKAVLYSELVEGDFISLYRDGKYFHNVIITKIHGGEIYTSSHTRDSFDKPLSSYRYFKARYIHVLGYRK